MRMWMCDTKIMCRQHLLGEYREIYAFIGSMRNKVSMRGYIDNNLLEPKSLITRHKELRDEMILRGYKPSKTWIYFDLDSLISYLGKDVNVKVDREKSLADLLGRCPDCMERYKMEHLWKTMTFS